MMTAPPKPYSQISHDAIDELLKEAKSKLINQPHVALELARQAEEMASNHEFGEHGYIGGSIESAIVQSHVHFSLSEYDKSLQMAHAAMQQAEDHGQNKLLAVALGRAGSAYVRLTSYAKGMEHYQRQLVVARQVNDSASITSGHRGMAIICGEMGRYEEAIEHSQASLEIGEAVGEMRGVSVDLANMARAHAHLGDFEEALALGQRGIAIAEQHCPEHLAAMYTNIGFVYAEKDDIEGALHYYNRSLDITNQFNKRYSDTNAVVDIAKLYIRKGDLDSAEKHIQNALEAAKSTNSQWQQFHCHGLLADIAEQRQDFKTALHHHKIFEQLQTEAVGEKNAEKLRQLQVAFEVEEAHREAELYRTRTEALAALVDERTVDLKQALEREQVLANNLAQALAQSEAANELRANIITTVSHEFRTPMTVIKTSAELLERHAPVLSAEKSASLHERIKSSTNYLTALLRDVVLVNGMNRNEATVEKADVEFVSLCRTVEAFIMTTLNHPTNVAISYDEGDTTILSTDPTLLQQIGLNLVKNALSFSAETDPISVAFSVNATHFTLTVDDNGIGIHQDDLDEIFNLFYRGANIEQRRGLGAGLYISQSMAQSLGATLTAQSDGEGEGATFTLSIPLSQA